MMQKPILQDLPNLGFFLLAFVPLIMLSYYNHPSPADDFCYIDTVFKYGYFEAMHFYYTGWTGRYFGILINHSNPLIFRWIEGFKVIPIILLLELIANLHALGKVIFKGHSVWTYLGMGGILFFLFIFKMASISEAFYWMAAFVTYTLPNILTLYWFVVMIRWYQMPNDRRSKLTAVWLAFLTFAVIGCSETNLIVMVLLVGGWFGYQLVINRKLDTKALFLVLVAAFSCYLFFSSEGNQARISGNPISRNIPFSLEQSLLQLSKLVLDWFRHTPLLTFTILFIAWLQNHFKKQPNNIYLSVYPFWAALAFVGILVAQIFPSYYGIGIEPTPRVVNCVYLFFLIGWFYNVAVWTHRIAKNQWFTKISLPTWVKAALTISICYMTYNSPNLRMIYGDWLHGKAAAYDKELYARYDLIKNTKADTVYVKALQNRPQSLFVEDLNSNPKHWWNKCTAGYFGKNVIYLDQKP